MNYECPSPFHVWDRHGGYFHIHPDGSARPCPAYLEARKLDLSESRRSERDAENTRRRKDLE